MSADFDLVDIKRRMQGAVQAFKHDLGGLRTGRASASMLDPIQVDAYGAMMPLNQVATVSVPEPRMLSVQVWDRSMVMAVDKAIRESSFHRDAEESRVAARHVRRDGLDLLKKLEKDGKMSEDDAARQSDLVQKATDQTIVEIDQALSAKEKEIMQV